MVKHSNVGIKKAGVLLALSPCFLIQKYLHVASALPRLASLHGTCMLQKLVLGGRSRLGVELPDAHHAQHQQARKEARPHRVQLREQSQRHRTSAGADPELVSRGGGSHVERPSPPHPPFLPFLPPSLPCPFPSLPCPFPILPLPPSLSPLSPPSLPLPSPPLEGESEGSSPGKL